MSKLLISISGKKRSGKNTVAKLIAQHTTLRCEEFAFADALKQEVAVACGVERDFVEDNKDIFRPILQWWGTDFRRKFKGTDYWCKQMLYSMTQSAAQLLIVTDCRFKDEADCMREINGVLVRVNNSSKATHDTHASETNLDTYTFDYTINNDDSLDVLSDKVKVMLQRFNIPTK